MVPTNSTDTAVTVGTTTAQLARTFGIVVRQIADLLTMLQDYSDLAPALPAVLKIGYEEQMNLQVCFIFVYFPYFLFSWIEVRDDVYIVALVL